MSEEIATIEETKRKQWGIMGVAVYRSELQLQAQAQNIILALSPLPTKPEEINEAEAKYKTLRADAVKLQNDRKEVTSKFDAVTARLMEPEKSLAPAFLAYSEAIIKIKKAEEARVSASMVIEDEKKAVREYLSNEMAKLEAKFKALIAEKVVAAYAYALGEGNIAPEALDLYLVKCTAKLSAKDFPGQVKPMAVKHISQEEYVSIERELVRPTNWLQLYGEELNSRFKDYTIAFANKEQALRIAKEEADAKAKLDAEELLNKQAAAKLEAVAQSVTVSTDLKALKKVFKIQMEETPENAIRILSSVVANWKQCAPKIRVKKWFQFSVANAIVALEGMKNEDNAFAPTGIIFIETDKL